MIPIKIYQDQKIRKLKSHSDFTSKILFDCRNQRKNKGTLAFAFLIYDICNPNIAKILEDTHYWRALDKLSGKLLDIFYIDYTTVNSSQEVSISRDVYDDNELLNAEIIKISDKKIGEESPAILFFQVDDEQIVDNILIELKGEKVEDSFLNLKNYITEAVTALKDIKAENYNNLIPIMRELKGNVSSKHIRTETITAFNKYHLITVFKSIFKIFMPS